MRIKQREGKRGSLKFMQTLVRSRPHLLASRLIEAGALPASAEVVWRSPLPGDEWAEYRDAAFLDRIGHGDLASALRAFWPSRGPQWDGLALSGQTVLLVEAKAHIAELASTCTAKAQGSRSLIAKSLATTKEALGVDANADWLTGYYQMANRIAHLHFLRAHGVDARLVLLQFTGETDMPTPATREAYKDAFEAAERHLGLNQSRANPYVLRIYIDVAELA